MNSATRIAAVLIFGAVFGCSSAKKLPFETPPQVQQLQIERKIAEIPYTRDWERIRTLDWLTRWGEAAFPALIDALGSKDADTRAASANVLGRSQDRRVIPFVAKIADDPDTGVRYEVARSLLRLGDWSRVPVLIHGLRDEREYARALCNDALRQYTKVDFGFAPSAPKDQREEPVRKWENWWNARAKDAFFGKDGNTSRATPKSAGSVGPRADS